MNVIIPVAGKGTRLRPFTHTRAKPLLPVAGKPVIDHILDRVLTLNPTEITFVTGHLKDQFERYIRERYEGQFQMSFVEQTRPRGTAQAIYLARHAFDEDVLIVFSDTIFDADLSLIKKCKDDGIFWSTKVEDPRRFGVMVTDEHGYLTKIVEKPQEFVSDLANIGLYYIKNTTLLAEGLKKAVEFIDEREGEVFHVEAFEYMLSKNAKIKVVPATGWYDCGTMEETLETNRVLLMRAPTPKAIKGVTIIPPVAIDASAVISDSTIGPNVSIGPHTKVKNCTLKDAIVDAHTELFDAQLENTILGQHVIVHNQKGSLFLGDHSRVK